MVKTRLQNLAELLLAGLFLVAIFIWYSFPLILNWNEQIIGLDTAFADTPQILSNLYLFEKGWENGNLWFTQELFYPFGASTLMHGFTPGMGFLYLISGMGAFPFLNTFTLACFVLGGLGAFQLAKKYTPHFVSALLVAFVFSFSCFHLAQWQDHYWYILNFTLPWYLIHFPRIFDFHPRHGLFRLQSWKALVYCMLLGVISASLDYYTTFFLIYLSLLFFVWKRFLSRINWSASLAVKLILACSLLVLGSLLIDVLRRAGWDDNHGFYWSGDVAGFIIPQNNRIYGNLFYELAHGNWTQPGPNEKNLFLGFSLILALGYAKYLHWKGASDSALKQLFLVSFLLILFCFPLLKVFGYTLLKLPSAFLHYIPFLNNIRVPTRWGILLYLFASLYMVRAYALNLSTKQNRMVLWVLLSCLVLEYWPKPYSFFPTANNTYALEGDLIQKEKGDILLSLPFGIRDGFKMRGNQDTRQMYLQSLHGKKLIGGYFSRLNDSLFYSYTSDPLCNDLFTLIEDTSEVIHQRNYHLFFQNFHPDLLYVRQDYQGGVVFRHFQEAARQNQISLVQVDAYLWRLEYP